MKLRSVENTGPGEESEYSRSCSGTHNQNHIDNSEDGGAMALPTPVVPPATNTTANHLLFIALLELLTSVYEPNQEKAGKVFRMLCKHLRKMKVIDSSKSIDEMVSLRRQCKDSFMKLMHGCVNVINKENRPCNISDRIQLIFQPSLTLENISLTKLYECFHSSKFKDEYNMVKTLGEGAYGTVFEVRSKIDDRLYAVKKIGFEDEPDIGYKILREVKFLASLSHTNIVRYFHAWLEHKPLFYESITHTEITEIDVSTGPTTGFTKFKPSQPEALKIEEETTDINYDDDSVIFEESHVSPTTVLQQYSSHGSSIGLSGASRMPKPCVFVYIQMELCHTTLKDWLQDRNDRFSRVDKTAFNREVNMKIIKQILRGVDHIHSNNLLHRDLKPHNIFIICTNNSLKIKIGDFGLSRTFGSSAGADNVSSTPLTPHPGMKKDGFDWTDYTSGVGTTIYAAPEQLSGSDYNQKCDMYSIGLIMYEIFQPFGTEMERRQTLKQIRSNGLPEEFCSKWPDVSRYIANLLLEDMGQRFTAKELLETELFISKDQIIDNLTNKLEEQQKVISDKDKVISNLQKQLTEKDAKLMNKDAEIARLQLSLMSLTQAK